MEHGRRAGGRPGFQRVPLHGRPGERHRLCHADVCGPDARRRRGLLGRVRGCGRDRLLLRAERARRLPRRVPGRRLVCGQHGIRVLHYLARLERSDPDRLLRPGLHGRRAVLRLQPRALDRCRSGLLPGLLLGLRFRRQLHARRGSGRRDMRAGLLRGHRDGVGLLRRLLHGRRHRDVQRGGLEFGEELRASVRHLRQALIRLPARRRPVAELQRQLRGMGRRVRGVCGIRPRRVGLHRELPQLRDGRALPADRARHLRGGHLGCGRVGRHADGDVRDLGQLRHRQLGSRHRPVQHHLFGRFDRRSRSKAVPLCRRAGLRRAGASGGCLRGQGLRVRRRQLRRGDRAAARLYLLSRDNPEGPLLRHAPDDRFLRGRPVRPDRRDGGDRAAPRERRGPASRYRGEHGRRAADRGRRLPGRLEGVRLRRG